MAKAGNREIAPDGISYRDDHPKWQPSRFYGVASQLRQSEVMRSASRILGRPYGLMETRMDGRTYRILIIVELATGANPEVAHVGKHLGAALGCSLNKVEHWTTEVDNDGLKRLREFETNPAALAELRSGPEALPVVGFSWMLF